MQKWISFFLLLMITEGLFASDSIPVVLNAKKFSAGDTIEFNWNGNLIGKGYAAASLHLWVDHLETGRRWKLRYPILNGLAEGSLVITDSLPVGNYAFNFMAAEPFLEIKG